MTDKKVNQTELAEILGITKGALSFVKSTSGFDMPGCKGKNGSYDYDAARELILNGWKSAGKQNRFLAKLALAFGRTGPSLPSLDFSDPPESGEPVTETTVTQTEELVLKPHKEFCNNDLRSLYTEGTTLVLKLAAFLDRLNDILDEKTEPEPEIKKKAPDSIEPEPGKTWKKASILNTPIDKPFSRYLLLRKDGKIFSAGKVGFRNRMDLDGYIKDCLSKGISVFEVSNIEAARIKNRLESSAQLNEIDGIPVLGFPISGGKSVDEKCVPEADVVYPVGARPPGR
jgi:hypothetical protein